MVKKRGLGKPLDALLVGSSSFAEDASAFNKPSKEKLAQLSTAQIQRGKYQPRREMKLEALEELANSIRAQGVIQPIVVRPLLGGKYEIIAGERRWRAAQMAGLKEIPALIKDIADQAAVAIALIENIQRENLNPIEEAIALQRLLNEFSMTHQQVAEAVGKSRATVTNLLRLLTLADEVKAMLEQGKLEMGHARALLTLPSAMQIEAAAIVLTKNFSVRQTEELVRQLQMPPLTSTLQAEKEAIPDPDIKYIEANLAKYLKLPVSVQSNPKGAGKLVIRYKNRGELDAILEHFQQLV